MTTRTSAPSGPVGTVPAGGRHADAGRADPVVERLCLLLAPVAVATSAAGLLLGGGPGPYTVTTTRGTDATLFGEGLYRADTWLVGSGNRGQDVAVLLFEVPVLLVVLGRYRRGTASPVVGVLLTGVLAFFTYYFASMVLATAQNRLFPAYVVAASLAGFALLRQGARLEVAAAARALPARPGPGALVAYLIAVAAALTLAWLPEMLGAAMTGRIGEVVGPYTSAVTEALDLGVVVPVAVIAAVQILRRRTAGRVLALVLLVLNVCIGVLLMAQAAAQLLSGVPLTPAEIVAKCLTFAMLTLVAGGLLLRMVRTVPGTLTGTRDGHGPAAS